MANKRAPKPTSPKSKTHGRGEEAVNLTQSLAALEEIADWFDSQESVDVEEGLKKVKQAAQLIKGSQSRLADIENEFREIEKDIAAAPPRSEPIDIIEVEAAGETATLIEDAGDQPVNLDDIPF